MSASAVFLRVMVEVETEAEALAQRDAIVAVLGAYGSVETRRVEPYWKMPEYWDVSVRLDPAEDAVAVFEQIVASAPEGWLVGEVEPEDLDRWAVWNAQPGAVFLVERARWAAVEVGPPAVDEAGSQA